jgi:type VI secretion system secreted protein VgrG
VVGSTVHIENAAEVSGQQGGDQFFCHFSVIQSRQPFRSMQTAVRPTIAGLQTAVVSGSDTAEDISVDKYGRIQATFHWNKPDKENFHISCPVRVASSWAGKNWGAVNIPRVGQEVVVSFLEGDPDRPLVIGSVYNADNMPPYALPDNKTQSGIKSRSHQGGGADDFNELRFEDKKGSEDFFMHAQKDMHVEVENDRVVAVDNDEKMTIKNDQTEDVKGKRTTTVGKDDKLDVTGNGTTTIGQKFKLSAGTEIELVTGAASIVMKSSGDIDIKGVSVNIKGVNVKIDGDATVAAKGGASAELSSSGSTTVKGSMLSLKGDGMAQLSGGIIMIG